MQKIRRTSMQMMTILFFFDLSTEERRHDAWEYWLARPGEVSLEAAR